MFKIGDIVTDKDNDNKDHYEVISVFNDLMILSPYYECKNFIPINDLIVKEQMNFKHDIYYSRKIKLKKIEIFKDSLKL